MCFMDEMQILGQLAVLEELQIARVSTRDRCHQLMGALDMGAA